MSPGMATLHRIKARAEADYSMKQSFERQEILFGWWPEANAYRAVQVFHTGALNQVIDTDRDKLLAEVLDLSYVVGAKVLIVYKGDAKGF